jgi:hypothetical protein
LVSSVSIKKSDGKPFNFKSIYLYVVDTRQQIKVAAFRARSEVSGLSQIYDLYGDTNHDVTFAPSNWNDIDELKITNKEPLLRMKLATSIILYLILIILHMKTPIEDKSLDDLMKSGSVTGLGLLIVKEMGKLAGVTINVTQTDVTSFHWLFGREA